MIQVKKWRLVFVCLLTAAGVRHKVVANELDLVLIHVAEGKRTDPESIEGRSMRAVNISLPRKGTKST